MAANTPDATAFSASSLASSSTGASFPSVLPSHIPPYSYSRVANFYYMFNTGSALLLLVLWWTIPGSVLAKIVVRLWGWTAEMQAHAPTQSEVAEANQLQKDAAWAGVELDADQNGDSEGEEEEDEAGEEDPDAEKAAVQRFEAQQNQSQAARRKHSLSAILLASPAQESMRSNSYSSISSSAGAAAAASPSSLNNPGVASASKVRVFHSGSVVATIELPGPFASKMPPRLFMRPVPGRVHVLGRPVYLNAIDTSDPAFVLKSPSNGPFRRCGLWLASLACVWVPSVFRKRPVGVRIARQIRRLLWLASWASALYLFDVTLIHITRFGVGPVHAENTVSCPAGTLGQFCFDYHGGEEVDCYAGVNSFLPVGVSSIKCYDLLSPDSSTILSGISSVAALFTLVFGGMTQIMSWSLVAVKSRRVLYVLYLIPLVAFPLIDFWFLETENYSILAWFVYTLAVWTLVTLIRLRILVIEREEFGPGMDDSPRWASCITSCGCQCCMKARE